jgi:GTPase-associated protein 1, N-terminal domain type 1
MAQVDDQIIHQALFGYADGHRLIETSTRLSSRDLYDLSAVSDLASGVQLQPDESYLTGAALQDSRDFALIRTWPAPEMPRPGCVWSHVLILTPEILASQRDLGALNVLFAHPRSRNKGGHYTGVLDLSAGNSKSDAPPNLVAFVLSSYYSGRPFSGSLPFGPALDSAVLAVWSQQWPRLRASFSFRTARTIASSNRSSARFDFQPGAHSDALREPAVVGSADGIDVDWIEAAVADAISPEVTPLRRFLWRYGKDARPPRQRFQNLVKIHLATRTLAPDNLPLTWAESIASLFPEAENAATLKRDMLGLEPAPLALCPAVAHEDTLELLAVLVGEGAVISDKSLEGRLSKARAETVPALAASLGSHAPELAEQSATIVRVLTRIADDRAVTDTRVPPAVRLTILQGRHDLISAASLAAIGDDDLLSLLDIVEEDSKRTEIVDVVLRRDIAAYPDALVRQHAGDLLLRAISARSGGTLSHGATTVLRTRAREFISFGALNSVAGSAMAAQVSDLLNYPVDDEMASDVERWLSVLERLGPDAEGQSRVNFEAYMCVVAIKSGIPAAWDLLRWTLSGLRSIVLAGGLLNPAYELLDLQLPANGWSSWDFHKRILIGLRELRRRTGVDNSVVAQLALSDEDSEFVLDDRKGKKRDRGGSIFWPWS